MGTPQIILSQLHCTTPLTKYSAILVFVRSFLLLTVSIDHHGSSYNFTAYSYQQGNSGLSVLRAGSAAATLKRQLLPQHSLSTLLYHDREATAALTFPPFLCPARSLLSTRIGSTELCFSASSSTVASKGAALHCARKLERSSETPFIPDQHTPPTTSTSHSICPSPPEAPPCRLPPPTAAMP